MVISAGVGVGLVLELVVSGIAEVVVDLDLDLNGLLEIKIRDLGVNKSRRVLRKETLCNVEYRGDGPTLGEHGEVKSHGQGVDEVRHIDK